MDGAQRQQSLEQVGAAASAWSVRQNHTKNAREFVDWTPEGAEPVRTVHRVSGGKRCDAVFVSKMKGAPWDFKMNLG